MSILGRAIANGLFPLQEKLKKHSTQAVFHEMEQSQWWPAQQLAEFQSGRLRDFLCAVEQHVPFYRDLFARLEFKPQQLTGIADLQRLPLLDKSAIREHSNAMCSTRGESLSRFNTGGSSGEPLVFYLGKERVSHDVAAKRRATRWWQVDIGDPEIVVWGSPIEIGSQDRVRSLRDALFRTELLSAFEMSDTSLAHFIQRIRRRRPAMLFGYPSAIALIAEHAQKSGIPLDKLGIKVVFVTSERLYDHQRELITRCFGAPVANGYGGRDAGFIAHECPAGSLHITAEDIIVEILDDAGHAVPVGETGEIVTTHMATQDFPFIRYRTGDVGSLSADNCRCGRGLPVLASIEGRSTDFLRHENGGSVHALALIYVLRDMDCVAQFKIVQQEPGRVCVMVIADSEFNSGQEQEIVESFKSRLGDGMQIDVERVTEIPPEKSGKYRYVVNRIAQ